MLTATKAADAKSDVCATWLAYYKKSDFAGAAAQFASLHKDGPSERQP